jgi:hypothetical protein
MGPGPSLLRRRLEDERGQIGEPWTLPVVIAFAAAETRLTPGAVPVWERLRDAQPVQGNKAIWSIDLIQTGGLELALALVEQGLA